MNKFKWIVLGSLMFFNIFSGESRAQVSWVYWQNLPSVGSTKQDFLNWLNNERATRGLRPVQYDTSLDAESNWNSYLQSINGLGHWYQLRAIRQNASAVPDFGRVGPAWLQSTPHAAALFDPNISWISIMMYGTYTTFSAY